MNWYDDWQNVQQLAAWLAKHEWFHGGDQSEAISNVLYYYSKPWKWDAEWRKFRAETKAKEAVR